MSDHILIIGAGGFVGRRLVHALAGRGDRVLGLYRHAPSELDDEAEIYVSAGHDPEDYQPLLRRSRAVIHVASASTPGGSAARPMLELDENLRPTLALLQALQQFPKTPLLYVSSGGTLYDTASTHADESAMVSPRSYHGAGKIAAEHFIAAWCFQFGGAATILRPSNVYGPGQTQRAGFGIVPTTFDKLLREETLHVWGDGSARRDYLYVDDFVRLCLTVLDAAPIAGARVFNACSGSSITLNDLFSMMERVTGHRLQRSYDATRAVDMPRVDMRADRVREQYGWAAQTGMEEGLAQAWKWFSTTRQ